MGINVASTVDASAFGVYAAYTPTIKGGATTVTTSALTARYTQIGKWVHAYGIATVSSAGGTNGAITVTVPVAPNTSIATYPVGTGDVQDTGTASYRGLVANIQTAATATIRFFRDATTNGNEVGVAPAFTLASGDIILWNITYEAA